jgi:hypothetical protein
MRWMRDEAVVLAVEVWDQAFRISQTGKGAGRRQNRPRNRMIRYQPFLLSQNVPEPMASSQRYFFNPESKKRMTSYGGVKKLGI